MKTALCLVFLALVGCTHTPRFRNKASATSVAAARIGEIDEWNLAQAFAILAAAPKVVLFTIDSPGGSVSTGLEFIELMREAQQRGSTIHCTIDGMAASMAAVIFERCDVRLIKRDSALMFHTVSVGGAEGNQWDFERLSRYMAALNRRLAILASAKMNISLAEYEKRVADNDWWLGWEEAIAVGAADAVR